MIEAARTGRVVHVDPNEARRMGRKLRRIRQDRRLSLDVVAGQAGISAGHLSRIERGERALDSLTQLFAIAKALEISSSEITRLPVPVPGNGHTDSGVEAVRHAIAAVDYGEPGGLMVPADVLRERVISLRIARRACRFRDVREALPGLIRDIHTSVNAGRDVAELLPLAVVLHVQVTQMWLRDAGAHPDLRREVATLARNLAREHDDPTSLGVAAFGRVNALRESGLVDLAQAELDTATLPAVSHDTVDLVGTLLQKHADVAVLDGRSADADAALTAAGELADRFGESPQDTPSWFGFGPVAVGLRRMSLALEAGEPDRAVSVAEGIQPERAAFSTRQAAFWVDYGRGLVRLPGRRDDAVRAMRTAESIFPHRVYRNPFAREAIGELLHRARRDSISSELRGLAQRIGL